MNTQQIIQKIVESAKNLTGSSMYPGDKNSYIEINGRSFQFIPTSIETGYFNEQGEKLAEFVRGDKETLDNLMSRGEKFFRVYEDKTNDEFLIVQFL